ncbi:MAG: hypothetical protein V5B33_18520 [Candidatus Accumulibacter sp. UW20]|jgi:hypothetical protein
MPIVRNRLFQPVGILLTDGRALYLQSRQAIEVSDTDLDSPHLKSMLASEQLMLTEPGAEGQLSTETAAQESAGPGPVATKEAPMEAAGGTQP